MFTVLYTIIILEPRLTNGLPCGGKFSWDLIFANFVGFFIDLQKLNPVKINLCPKNSVKSYSLLFMLLNFDFNSVG